MKIQVGSTGLISYSKLSGTKAPAILFTMWPPFLKSPHLATKKAGKCSSYAGLSRPQLKVREPVTIEESARSLYHIAQNTL